MEDVLKWLQFSVSVLPFVLQGIMLAEQTIGAGNGQAKKDLVMSALAPAAATAGGPADMATMLRVMIDTSVAALNRSGKLPATRV